MLDIGWSELMVIGVVALVVIGPKDLPVMFAALGRFTAKARSMAREFSRAMEDAAKSSGVGDVAKDLKGMTSAKNLGLDKVQQAVNKFEAWDPMKKSAPTTKAPTAPAAPVAPAPAGKVEAAATASVPLGAAGAATSASGAAAPVVESGAVASPVASQAAQPASVAAPAPAPVPVDPLNGT